jgi:hypothetical protein
MVCVLGWEDADQGVHWVVSEALVLVPCYIECADEVHVSQGNLGCGRTVHKKASVFGVL